MKRKLITSVAAIFLGFAPSVEAAGPTAADPLAAARYSTVIDGVEIASFSSLDAIASGPTAAGVPGEGCATLHRGVTSGLELWSWHEAVTSGNTHVRKDVSLVAYSTEGTPVMRFFLTHAWPSRIEIAGLKAGSSEVLTETVTLACTHISRMIP